MSKNHKKFLAYLIVLIIPFIFLFLRPKIFTPLKFQIVQGTSLPVRILLFPFREIRKMLTYHRTYEDYRRLKQEVAILTNRITGQEELLRENERLRDILDLKKGVVFSSVTANVIGRDPSNWNAVIIVDKGEADGISTDMPVVNTYGVVGKVAEAGPKTSKILLLSDPGFSVAALNQRTREGGVVTGTLQGVCRLRYLPPDSKVEVGDLVVTSKLSSSFPEGLLLGRVIKLEASQSSPTIECLVQPAVALSQLEEVLIIQK